MTNNNPYMIIDIETLGTGQQAPIFAVAALLSDGRNLTASLDLNAQFRKGAEPTHECCHFWLQQPASEWLDCYALTSPKTLLWAINDMYTYGMDVWTRGDFDIPILGNLFRRFDLADDRDWHPWDYHRLHNIRTAQMMVGKNEQALKIHDPLQDCTDDKYIIDRWYNQLDFQETFS